MVVASKADGAAIELSETSKALDAGHTISIYQGTAYSHCHNRKLCDNELGELGRSGKPFTILPVALLGNDQSSAVPVAHAYTGGFASSGHSALLDKTGYLWLCGCDRWQQLGLGSSHGGSSGYTWKGGKLWQNQFQKSEHVLDLMKSLDPSLTNDNDGGVSQSSSPLIQDLSRRWVRDVALGGDHTIVLSSNKKDVIAFGKGGEDQLGLSSKPWVSSPAKSKLLSSKTANISAVCAFRNCSMTLNDSGEVMGKAGKCSMELKGMKKAFELCRKRAQETGLLD